MESEQEISWTVTKKEAEQYSKLAVNSSFMKGKLVVLGLLIGVALLWMLYWFLEFLETGWWETLLFAFFLPIVFLGPMLVPLLTKKLSISYKLNKMGLDVSMRGSVSKYKWLEFDGAADFKSNIGQEELKGISGGQFCLKFREKAEAGQSKGNKHKYLMVVTEPHNFIAVEEYIWQHLPTMTVSIEDLMSNGAKVVNI
jgi:hypothetical protein